MTAIPLSDLQLGNPKIVVPQPLEELKNYFWEGRIPSLYFFARLVKTCVGALFTRHFHEESSVIVINGGFVYCWKMNKAVSERFVDFNQNHPLVIKSGLVYSISKAEWDQFKSLTQMSWKNVAPLVALPLDRASLKPIRVA